jgi:hypothetical protein
MGMSSNRVFSRPRFHLLTTRLVSLGLVGLGLLAGNAGCSSNSPTTMSSGASTPQSGSSSGDMTEGSGSPLPGNTSSTGSSSGSTTPSGGAPSSGGSPSPSSSGNSGGASSGSGNAGGGNSGGGNSGGGSSSGGSTAGNSPGNSGASGSSSSGASPTNGSGDASTPSASGSDAGDGSLAATGCAGKSYKLCEDFETGTVGSLGPGWTQFAGYGTPGATDVALANDAAHSGKMSLKSDSINRGQTRAQKSLSAIGATASNHWGRIFYKVEEPAPKPLKTATNTVIHITWTSLIGPAGENRVVDIVENMAGMHQWLFNIPSDGCCTSSAYNWTFDPPDGGSSWHCAEWWVDVATDSYRFFSDSSEVTSLAFSGNTKSTMSDYTAIVVGATWYQQAGTILTPFVIWFDDLAIDDNRVGCQ